MTPQTRFRLWVSNVVAVTVVLHFWFALSSARAEEQAWIPILGGTVVIVLLSQTALLILTTPPNAIKLRPERSVVLLTLLTLACYGHAWILFDRSTFGAAVVVLVVGCAAGFARLAAGRGISPWWVGPLFWTPMLVGPMAISPILSGVLALLFESAIFLVPRRRLTV